MAIGWMSNTALPAVKSRDEPYPLCKLAHYDDTSNFAVGYQVGQVAPDPSYVCAAGDDGVEATGALKGAALEPPDRPARKLALSRREV